MKHLKARHCDARSVLRDLNPFLQWRTHPWWWRWGYALIWLNAAIVFENALRGTTLGAALCAGLLLGTAFSAYWMGQRKGAHDAWEEAGRHLDKLLDELSDVTIAPRTPDAADVAAVERTLRRLGYRPSRDQQLLETAPHKRGVYLLN